MTITTKLPFVLLAIPLALALGCGGEEATEPPKTADATQEVEQLAGEMAEAGVLPRDEQKVPAPGAEGGVLQVSGEVASPVASELVPRTGGRVEAVLVDAGDLVREGQTLARLETDYLRLDRERAAAELSRARAARQEAESDFRRKAELLQRNSIPQAVHDRSKGAFEQAQAQVAAAQAALDLVDQRIADAQLRSPLDGVVAERRVDPGERLSDSTVAFVVMRVRPLELRFELPERYLPQVSTGQQVRARVDAYPLEVFAGEVVRLSRVVDPTSRRFRVVAQLPNEDGRLRPGMFARVELPAIRAAGGAVTPNGPSGEVPGA